MTKLIVFDVDGTILDSFGHFRRVVSEYSAAAGLPQPCLDTICRGYGAPRAHDFKWGVPREEQEMHLGETFRRTDALAMSGDPEWTPRLFAGVEEGLARLKDGGHRLAIVTSKPRRPLLHLLAHHGIAGLFCALRSRCDVEDRGEREKPAPDMLQSILRELDRPAGEAVMVGDTTMDMEMAVAAGAAGLGVGWGMHPASLLLEAGAQRVVETDFAGVVEAVPEIFT